MKPTRPLTGLVAAVHTPFRPDGSLSLDVSLSLEERRARRRLESLGFLDWIRSGAPS